MHGPAFLAFFSAPSQPGAMSRGISSAVSGSPFACWKSTFSRIARSATTSAMTAWGFVPGSVLRLAIRTGQHHLAAPFPQGLRVLQSCLLQQGEFLFVDLYGEDGLKNPTTEEWAAFAASCNLRDMGTHLCALPTGEHCPKGLICLGCAHAQPKKSAVPSFARRPRDRDCQDPVTAR